MKVIWPLLVASKAAGTAVTVSVSGCVGAHRQIYAIDAEPREAN